jgi:molybdopterin-guanine dinucleotide biosynthesis protein A
VFGKFVKHGKENCMAIATIAKQNIQLRQRVDSVSRRIDTVARRTNQGTPESITGAKDRYTNPTKSLVEPEDGGIFTAVSTAARAVHNVLPMACDLPVILYTIYYILYTIYTIRYGGITMDLGKLP